MIKRLILEELRFYNKIDYLKKVISLQCRYIKSYNAIKIFMKDKYKTGIIICHSANK